MQRFHLINLNTTVLGYNLANLEVAVGWFLLKRQSIRAPLWLRDGRPGQAGPVSASTSAPAATRAATTACRARLDSLGLYSPEARIKGVL